MKIQGHSNKLETNVENETQEFGIGDASVVIEILRNRLYTRPVTTLVQEYICNARDAMREVDKGNNFQVTVPTRLNPVFKVRDFGPGISPSRMKDVFVMYGSSTKRGTNGQTGGFGIGAKSAWSYTDSFTIVSIVDGMRRTYVAHTGMNNNGRLDLVSSDKTDEANGTEIQVAVKPYDIEEFRAAVFRAIYFWEEKPELKGELDPPTLVRGKVISDLVEVIDRNALPEYIRTHSYNDEALAIIDGVPYVINEKLFLKVKGLESISKILRKELILYFGNGVVEVSASRESISDSKHTVNALEKLAARALMEIQTHISTEFGKVSDTPMYLKTYSEVSPYFDVDNFAKFGEYSIESGHLKSPSLSKVKVTIAHCMGRSGRHRIDKVTKDEKSVGRREISTENFGNIFYLVKQDNKIVENKRIREFLKGKTHMVILEVGCSSIATVDKAGKPVMDKDGKPTFHTVSHDKEFAKVIKDLGAKEFQTITYVDPPKVVKEKVKREDSQICLHSLTGDRHKYTTLASNTQKWFFVPMKEGSWPASFTLESLKELNEYLSAEDIKVCGVAPRALKMIEGNENFSPLKEWLDNYTPSKDAIKSVKALEIAKNGEAIETLSRLKDLDDDFLVEMIKEYKSLKTKIEVIVPATLMNEVKKTQEVKDFKDADEKLTKLLKSDYPLVNEMKYTRHTDELAFYINAKFNKKGK